MSLDVHHLNATYPQYPVTVQDKGWVYGVWYCGTPWKKATLYGQYPATFMKRISALFPRSERVLHAPSGTLLTPYCLDRVVDKARRPHVQADCGRMPFKADTFDLIISDPPYSAKDSVIYGCAPFPMGRFLRESQRVLVAGGHLAILHTSYPSYRRKDWELVGLIAVVSGFLRVTRILSIFRKPEVLPQWVQSA